MIAATPMGMFTQNTPRQPSQVRLINPPAIGPSAPAIPVTARSDNAESGRGLLIVESLAKDWGSEHTGLGLLRVWASIAVFRGTGPDSGI